MIQYTVPEFKQMQQHKPCNVPTGVILPIQPNPSSMAADPSKMQAMQQQAYNAPAYPQPAQQVPAMPQGVAIAAQQAEYQASAEQSHMQQLASLTQQLMERQPVQEQAKEIQQAPVMHSAPAPTPAPAPAQMRESVPVEAHAQTQPQTMPASEPVASKVSSAANSDKFVSQFKNGFVSLPESIEECQAFAKYISASPLVPACIRNKPEAVYMLLARAVANGISWANMFSTLFVIGDKNGNVTVGMYVKAKAAMCQSKGQWEVSIDFQTGDATAKGKRYDSGQEISVTYSAYEASLTGKLKRDANGAILGNGVWGAHWPDMMKNRALGRLLDALFPDIVGGFVSKEDYDDHLYAEQLQAEQAEQSEAANNAAKAIAKVRKSRSKAKANDSEQVTNGAESANTEQAITPLSDLPIIEDDSALEPSVSNPLA